VRKLFFGIRVKFAMS